MSLLPRTNPLEVCPRCGVVHPSGQPACPSPADPALGAPLTARGGPSSPAEPASPLALAPSEARPARPALRPLSDEKIRSLVDQGIIVDEDAHGVHLTGKPVRGRGKATGQLSATDIVRLAAELDGGVLPADQRRHCPHCDAVVAPQAGRCEWCGKSLAAPSS